MDFKERVPATISGQNHSSAHDRCFQPSFYKKLIMVHRGVAIEHI